MKTTARFFFYFVMGVMAFACTQEGDVLVTDNNQQEYSEDNEHIKYILMNGRTVHKFLYDQTGKFVEENSRLYFNKFSYDEKERLVKVESAIHPAAWSSSSYVIDGIDDMMTSQNSSATSYSLYFYDNAGRLSKIEYYSNMGNEPDGEFEHRSTQTFEYKGSLIDRVNLGDPTTIQTAPTVYEYTYDSRGNVINEKYYTNINSTPKLSSETSYKFDDYRNPFQIKKSYGKPGFYSNPNNIIEIIFTSYEDIPGIDKYSTSKQTYEYNSNDYPVKIIQDGKTVEEYVY